MLYGEPDEILLQLEWVPICSNYGFKECREAWNFVSFIQKASWKFTHDKMAKETDITAVIKYNIWNILMSHNKPHFRQ